MEAYVVVAPFFMHETGQNMFAGVLLHIVKALFPVHRAGYLFAYGKRGRQEMRQGIVLANGHMQYGEGAKRTAVGALTAFFGEKSGAVQNNGKAVIYGDAGQHCGFKLGNMGICVIYFFGHFT